MLTKPWIEHLEERLKTVDDFVGYLSAAFTEGKDTFYLAVRDVTLITHRRAATAALEQAAQTVIDFDDWKGCGCSECKADARSHAVNESESMASLAMEIRALKPDAAIGDDKEDKTRCEEESKQARVDERKLIYQQLERDRETE